MIHTGTVSAQLLAIGQQLCANPQLNSFRIVDGTAISLHLGHRKSVDIDFFTGEKVNLKEIRFILRDVYPQQEFDVTQHSISASIKGVSGELFVDWHTPFLEAPVIEGGLRLASLPDLSALNLMLS
jgi:hypothetical protein